MMEEELRVLQPDTVLPCQLPDLASWPARAHWGRVERDPYRKLAWAVIERAIMDSGISAKNARTSHGNGWTTYQGRRRRLDRLTAIAWLQSPSREIMSFAWYLELLGYDPEVALKQNHVLQVRGAD